MKKIYLILSLFATILFCSFILGDDFFDVQLNDLGNKKVLFQDLKTNKATVVVFLLSDCPASQSYTLTLNKLFQKYSSKNISFIGIFPGKYSTDNEIISFRDQYKILFPLFKDPDLILGRMLKAAIAPGCFLVDKTGSIVYEGRIDDWLYAIGKKKPGITQKNLEDAIVSVINNVPVKIKKTEAIGCILEYE